MKSDLKISEVEIMPVKPRNGLVAFASFVLNDRLYVGSVAIFTKIDGSGFRLVYPTKKVGMKNINICHPINTETSRVIEEAVFKKLNEIFNETIYEQSTTN